MKIKWNKWCVPNFLNDNSHLECYTPQKEGKKIIETHTHTSWVPLQTAWMRMPRTGVREVVRLTGASGDSYHVRNLGEKKKFGEKWVNICENTLQYSDKDLIGKKNWMNETSNDQVIFSKPFQVAWLNLPRVFWGIVLIPVTTQSLGED